MIKKLLIFSAVLNITLLGALASFMVQTPPVMQTVVRSVTRELETGNRELLASMSKLSFRELVSFLTNRDLLEEGFTKRDLALAALVAFHHFDLERALGGPLAQVRAIDETIHVFPGLSEDQFEAIIRFAYQEKWPLSAKGLFARLKEKRDDESLEQAFMMTAEFEALRVLFLKTAAPQESSTLLRLVCEGTWDFLEQFFRQQQQVLDLSVEKRRAVLLSYMALHSPTAAQLLLATDFSFVLKKMEDKVLLELLALLHEPTPERTQCCTELLRSPRTDAVWQAAKAYVIETPAVLVEAPPISRLHVVKEGETLWKISRLYKVKVEEIVQLNGLEKNALFPGMTLKLPQGTGSEPPR